MATREEYARLPLAQRLDRLERTPADLGDSVRGRSRDDVGRRPDAKSWSATEVFCHLRDIEEICMLRFRTMLATEEPKVLVVGARVANPAEWGLVGAELAIDPERWAEERQYSRCDPDAALEAFRRRRRDSLDLFGRLAPEQWQRGCQHPTLGRVTFADWTALMAAHDDVHLAQVERAIAGKP
ncbi:MAG: hypothetical protein DMD91_17765 [Candidatus Rokuibacteriota bacterium]|nr:MAG: hypothetical protein DMD91_17765 [Candidatus Rokubacteria bacterium]